MDRRRSPTSGDWGLRRFLMLTAARLKFKVEVTFKILCGESYNVCMKHLFSFLKLDSCSKIVYLNCYKGYSNGNSFSWHVVTRHEFRNFFEKRRGIGIGGQNILLSGYARKSTKSFCHALMCYPNVGWVASFQVGQ